MKTLIIAPHPDDEVLGCGGTLLRRKREGGSVSWLIMTSMREEEGWKAETIRRREEEIRLVADSLQFDETHELDYPTAKLDLVPRSELVERLSSVILAFAPDEVLMPHAGDVHSDHRIAFEAAVACVKWYRCESVRWVMAYETPSETDFCLNRDHTFRPNYFVDISDHLPEKIEIMKIYRSEFGESPFPRSPSVIRGLAAFRGAASGFEFAESFELLRGRE